VNVYRNMRKKQNLTQEELAKKLGVERSTVAKWETEKSIPRVDALLKMSAIFGCTTDELLKSTR